MVQIKRVYEKGTTKDGYRVLVDRLWPRGIKKEDLKMDEWIKDLAPSNELRKSFGHDPKKWKSFQEMYREELKNPTSQGFIKELAKKSSNKTITLLFGAKDEEHNNAVVLKNLIEKEALKLKNS